MLLTFCSFWGERFKLTTHHFSFLYLMCPSFSFCTKTLHLKASCLETDTLLKVKLLDIKYSQYSTESSVMFQTYCHINAPITFRLIVCWELSIKAGERNQVARQSIWERWRLMNTLHWDEVKLFFFLARWLRLIFHMYGCPSMPSDLELQMSS